MSLDELRDVRQELDEKRREHADRENDAHPRIVDEDRYLVSLLRLEKQIKDLEEEERRLSAELDG